MCYVSAVALDSFHLKVDKLGNFLHFSQLYINHVVFVQMMNDSRGHRRLRLCSSKHYHPKPRNYLSYASPFSFSQMEMSSIRWHVTLELFLNKLLH